MHRDRSRFGDPTIITKASEVTFNKPLSWKEPRKIFTCSWSDFFIAEADRWRGGAWEVIRHTSRHTYQILTKRPERIKKCLPPNIHEIDNLWIGVTIENNKEWQRIHWLLDLPANINVFISFEPLLEPIIWRNEFNHVDWVIVGGESGNETGKYGYRGCMFVWINAMIESAKLANVPVFVKQMGTHLAKENKFQDKHGGDMSEWPPTLQVRQTP